MNKRQWKELYRHQITLGVCYCALCGQRIENPKDFSLDHATPKCRQGFDSVSNWLPSHKSCNNEKGALTLEQYNQWKYLEFLRNGGRNR